MAWKSNELLGASQKLLDILNNPTHAAEITAAGLSPAALITALTTPKTQYSAIEQEQEMYKTKLSSASVVERARGQTLYDKISDQVDGISGMVGKKTVLGKELRAA